MAPSKRAITYDEPAHGEQLFLASFSTAETKKVLTLVPKPIELLMTNK
jgi:hypothetical protein